MYWKDVKDSTDRRGTERLPRQVPGGHLCRPGAPAPAQARRRRQYAGPDRSQRPRRVPGVPCQPAGPRGHRVPDTATTPVGRARAAGDAIRRGFRLHASRSRAVTAAAPAGDFGGRRRAERTPPASWLPVAIGIACHPAAPAPQERRPAAVLRGARRAVGGGAVVAALFLMVQSGRSRATTVGEPRRAASLSAPLQRPSRRRSSWLRRRRCAAPAHGASGRATAPRRMRPPRRPQPAAAKVKAAAPAPAPEHSRVAVPEPVAAAGESRGRASAARRGRRPAMRWRPARTRCSCSRSSAWPSSARNRSRNHAAVREAPGRSQAARGQQGPQLQDRSRIESGTSRSCARTRTDAGNARHDATKRCRCCAPRTGRAAGPRSSTAAFPSPS